MVSGVRFRVPGCALLTPIYVQSWPIYRVKSNENELTHDCCGFLLNLCWKCVACSHVLCRCKNCSQNFPGFPISGRINSAMITNAVNSRPNGPPTGCLVSIFTVRTTSKSFPWAPKRDFLKFSARSVVWYSTMQCWCGQSHRYDSGAA